MMKRLKAHFLQRAPAYLLAAGIVSSIALVSLCSLFVLVRLILPAARVTLTPASTSIQSTPTPALWTPTPALSTPALALSATLDVVTCNQPAMVAVLPTTLNLTSGGRPVQIAVPPVHYKVFLPILQRNATSRARTTPTAPASPPAAPTNSPITVEAGNASPFPATQPGRTTDSLPFLELPFPYDGGNEKFGGTDAQFRTASQRLAAGGRLISFFDHLYPLYPSPKAKAVTAGREPADPPIGDNVLIFDGLLSNHDN